MAQCSNCGFELDDRRALPPSCPRCGAAVARPSIPIDESPGAPPDFHFEPELVPGTTLFGVPQLHDGEQGPPGLDPADSDGEIDLPGLPAGPMHRAERAMPGRLAQRPSARSGNVPPTTPLLGKPAAPPPLPRLFAAPRGTFCAPKPGGTFSNPTPKPTSFTTPRPSGFAPPQQPGPPQRPGGTRSAVPAAIPRPPTPPAAFDPNDIQDLPSPLRTPSTRTRPVPGQPHGELDLGEQDELIELDLPTTHRSTPLPGELALPTAGLGGLDLPTPVQKPTPEPRRPPGFATPPTTDGLAPRRGPGPKAPPPPPAHGQAFLSPGIDLPAPAQLDLPAPATTRGAPPAAELELPPPGSFEVPTPIGLDLPQPSDLDLPQPIGLDLEPVNNLPQPVALELEPHGGNWVQPAELGVQPAELNVQPAELGLEPANLGLEPANLGLAPVAKPRGVPTLPTDDPRGGPSVREVDAPRVSRGLLYGGAAIVLLGALGAGLLYSGVLDPEVEEPQPRGLANNKPKDKGVVDSDGMPVTPAAERSDAVLAKLRADTPKAYAEAAEEAKAASDRLGVAEALLLTSLRYGPDPALVQQAADLVAPYAKQTEPFVVRVHALVALAKGDEAKAVELSSGDSPREQLYRGLAYLGQGKYDEAITAAAAVLATDAGAPAALHLQHAAGVAKDAGTELPMLEQTAAKNPDHPGLQELRLRAGIQLGRLAIASDALDKIEAADDAPAAFRARRATLEGMLAAAQGDLRTATAKYDQALALVPKNVDARIGKIRALLAGGDVQAMLPEIKALAEERPNDPEVALLRVEVAIAAGDGDKALEMLAALEKSMPDRIEVPFLRGQVHAMRLQIDEAKAAFAKVLEKDPHYYAASLAEAQMLGQARMGTEAVAVLDAALRKANEAGASGPVQARLLVAKARLLARQDQRTAALAALDSAVSVDPASNDAQVLRGQLRLDDGRVEDGRADLVAVYERTGGYPGLAAPLGRLFVQEGNIDDAMKLVGDAATDDRAPAELKLVAARIELAKRDTEAAKVQLSQVLAQDGANWEAHMLMAQAFLDERDHVEALARVKQSLPGEPKAELHLLRGKILEFNAMHDQARPEYLTALKIDPQLHEARFLYGRLLAYTGAAGAAKTELQTVIDATGDRFPEAWLNLGRAQFELGEYEQAATSLAKATSLDATLQEGFFLEGRIYADRNQHAKAIELLQKATEGEVQGDWVPDAWATLGRAQAKAGQAAAAKASFKKFLEIAPADHASRAEAERQLRG